MQKLEKKENETNSKKAELVTYSKEELKRMETESIRWVVEFLENIYPNYIEVGKLSKMFDQNLTDKTKGLINFYTIRDVLYENNLIEFGFVLKGGYFVRLNREKIVKSKRLRKKLAVLCGDIEKKRISYKGLVALLLVISGCGGTLVGWAFNIAGAPTSTSYFAMISFVIAIFVGLYINTFG